MRPVILGLTGSEAMALRAEVDVRIDKEVARIPTVDPSMVEAAYEQISTLRSVRDKLDVALTVRESVISVPF